MLSLSNIAKLTNTAPVHSFHHLPSRIEPHIRSSKAKLTSPTPPKLPFLARFLQHTAHFNPCFCSLLNRAILHSTYISNKPLDEPHRLGAQSQLQQQCTKFAPFPRLMHVCFSPTASDARATFPHGFRHGCFLFLACALHIRATQEARGEQLRVVSSESLLFGTEHAPTLMLL